MIKIENQEVVGFEHAIRGMRNPMNSWDKSDSKAVDENCEDCMFKNDYTVCKYNPIHDCFKYDIGENDLDLMTRLSKAGTDHRKFMRMIVVYADITAPRYWWTEFDTYKIGTVANSCSTMHKIHEKEFTLKDFSHNKLFYSNLLTEKEWVDGDFDYSSISVLNTVIEHLNKCRKMYLETKDKRFWWQMIQLLPQSYNQKRTVMLNYEVLANMYHSRKTHKLDEWRDFCSWVENLPYSELITHCGANKEV